jgi:hypothetical protein
MAVVIGLSAYELALLAAGGITALYLASPPGQEATKEAARKTAEALEKATESLKQKQKQPDPKPDPVPPIVDPLPPTCTTDCEKEEEKCPVCGRGVNPTPGIKPPYLTAIPPRAPKDWETNPPLTEYKRTNKFVHGARVYEAPSGNFYHVDTFHKGSSSEVEVYDRKGRHLGAICPHCGSPVPGSKVNGRRLPD